MTLIDLAERGWFPDRLIRAGIRRLLAQRIRQETAGDISARRAATSALIDRLRTGSLAVHTQAANVQHYEVPAEFFQQVLGPRLKYSCCLFASPSDDLARAEERMLRLTAERAEVEDGMEILELGCGWGSLTLWLAEHFPAEPHYGGVELARAAAVHRRLLPGPGFC